MTKIEYKDLGGDFHGWAYPDENRVEIEQKLRGKRKQEIIIHELLHLVRPLMEEEEVEEISKFITDALWREGYRKIICNKIMK